MRILMYKHHIEEMVTAVNAALSTRGLEDAQAVVIERALVGYWADKMALTWDVSDVLEECPGLEHAEAIEVLAEVLEHHSDADKGVTWDTFRNVATNKFGERALGEDDDDEDAEAE